MSDIGTIMAAVILTILLRMLFFEPFNIPSGSMYPTLYIGDYVIVSKYGYGYSKYSIIKSPNLFEGRILDSPPERGEVAVFRNPTRTDMDYIKRVIGLPGDTIQLKQGRLYINDKLVERERIKDFIFYEQGHATRRAIQYQETLPNGKSYPILEMLGDLGGLDNTGIYQVPDGHYFMMGDNRDNSVDSRVLSSVGFVPYSHFIGPASYVVLSFDENLRWFNPMSWFSSLRLERNFTAIH